MKNIVLAIIIIGISIGLLGCSKESVPKNEDLSNGKNIEQQQDAAGMKRRISVDKAKGIALKHANLTSDKVTFIKSELDYDDGAKVYDIEFYYEDIEYDYEISAADGKIISADAEHNKIKK